MIFACVFTGVAFGPLRVRDVLAVSQSYLEFHTNRVRRDLLFFHVQFPESRPLLRAGLRDIDSGQGSFMAPLPNEDLLELSRLRQRLLLFRDSPPSNSGLALGIASFAGVTFLSAHAPGPFRVLFDTPVHLGPAIFDSGGVGVGLGGATW